MPSNKAETNKMRWKVFFIGSFIVAFMCATIYLFISAYDDKGKMITAPIQNDNTAKAPQNSSEKWH